MNTISTLLGRDPNKLRATFVLGKDQVTTPFGNEIWKNRTLFVRDSKLTFSISTVTKLYRGRRGEKLARPRTFRTQESWTLTTTHGRLKVWHTKGKKIWDETRTAIGYFTDERIWPTVCSTLALWGFEDKALAYAPPMEALLQIVEPLEIEIEKWQKQGLCPVIDNRLLIWKNVEHRRQDDDYWDPFADDPPEENEATWGYCGHQGMEYKVGESFISNGLSMGCAGPIGALLDWKYTHGDGYLIAILLPLEKTKLVKPGVYGAQEGEVISLYEVKSFDEEGCDLKLIEGVDALRLLGC